MSGLLCPLLIFSCDSGGMEDNFIPKGIPSLTYVRILPPSAELGANTSPNADLITDGNTVTVAEPGQPATRHEVAQVRYIINNAIILHVTI